MIKQSLKDNQVHISIDHKDFSYRIPLKKIGNSIDWKIGEKGETEIVMKKVSTWTLQLFTKNVTDDKYVTQFEYIVQEHAPGNMIDWEETITAVKVQNEYNQMIKANQIANNPMTQDEIIASLNSKYQLDIT